MCYKQFPFLLELKQNRSGKYPEGFFKEPCLHILSGEISFSQKPSESDLINKYKFDQNRFTKEKIRSATLLQRDKSDGVSMLLIL